MFNAPAAVFRQVRRLQIHARRAVEGLLSGEYRSAFKGIGLTFEEVRPYQPGDDVRAIDWNVTARTGQPFVKRFAEDRELTVVLAIDVSGSMGVDSPTVTPRRVVIESAAALAVSAMVHRDRVGLLLFSDRVDEFLPPRRGPVHVRSLLRRLLAIEPSSRRTNLSKTLEQLGKLQRRRAVVALFSDFRDNGFGRPLAGLARRHDLAAFVVQSEPVIGSAGLVQVIDPESGERGLVDLASTGFQSQWRRAESRRRKAAFQTIRSAGVEPVELRLEGRHLDELANGLRRQARRLP